MILELYVLYLKSMKTESQENLGNLRPAIHQERNFLFTRYCYKI